MRENIMVVRIVWAFRLSALLPTLENKASDTKIFFSSRLSANYLLSLWHTNEKAWLTCVRYRETTYLFLENNELLFAKNIPIFRRTLIFNKFLFAKKIPRSKDT
jgi:hypothetical protein